MTLVFTDVVIACNAHEFVLIDFSVMFGSIMSLVKVAMVILPFLSWRIVFQGIPV
jgi:hypothetical protein